MRKIFSLLCAALITLSVVNAQVQFNEHFDRPLGTLSASTWSGGTLANDSNWHTYSPGTVQFQVVDRQLNHADYCSAASGKAVQYTANHSRDYILFRSAISSVAGKKALLAFLIKVDELQTTSAAQSATNANNSLIAFAINASNNALGSLHSRVIIQTVDEKTYKLGVTRRGETPQFAANELKTGTTHLVVAEYAFVEGEKNDLINLYIDPTPSLQTVAVTSVNPSTASADADQLVGVALCSNGNTPTDMLIDEVRVASSWDDLWEDSSAPSPSITVPSSLSFDKVTIGEEAQKTLTVKGANLQGAISVVSDNAVLVPAVSSISKTDAEAEGGYALTLVVTATKEGEGKANLTLSSSGASDNIVVVSWKAVKPVPPVGSELLANGGFEQHSCNAIFGCSFDDWNLPLSSATVESTDIYAGESAMKVKHTSTANIDQGVLLTDDDYAQGTLFQLTIHYKVISMPDGSSLKLDSYWEPKGSGDAEEMKKHDADKLQRDITSAVSSDWEELKVVTSKPAASSYFRVRVVVPKSAEVLLDSFSLVRIEDSEPYIHVTPSTLNSVETTLGNTVDFTTVHISQGNLNGPTTFELSGYNPGMFSLSRSSLAADESECDLVITYKPTEAGTHTAILNIDNTKHTALFQSIKLTGTCTDPTKDPLITVSPDPMPAFEAAANDWQEQKFTVTSVNCTDYIYLSVNHIEGAAFTIDASMLSKNTTREVTVRFSPTEEGTYQSTVTISSSGAESVVVTLNGTATKGSGSDSWSQTFDWSTANPLKRMVETFDDVSHNRPLQIDRWQNVAAADARPWWGFDEAKTSPARGDGKYAKATTYQFGKTSTGNWEMWLVTPALDYKNAESKMFTFSCMAEYLADEGNKSYLEIYYIDPTDPANIYKQDLTSSFDLPSVSEDNLTWRTFFLDLAPYSETMADVFFMAFHFVGPNGSDGAITYFLDNVSWGRTDLPVMSVDVTSIVDEADLNEIKVVGQITVTTQNLTQPINVAVKGANYNKFKISSSTIEATGGALAVTFQSDQAGVHEAYIELSSSEATAVYIPMSILCKDPTQGIEKVQRNDVQCTKVLRGGVIYIVRDGKVFNVLGQQSDF